MKMPKLLHITCWYPSDENDKEAIWIKNHVHSIAQYVQNEVLHLDIRPGKAWICSCVSTKDCYHFKLRAPLPWAIMEVLNFFLLAYFLQFDYRAKSYDIVNFHIAYPQLVYAKYLKFLLPNRVFITEHWSAYHLNFGVYKPLPRIANIFKQGFSLITVSNALGKDIRIFCNMPNLPYHVVPNVVNTSVFFYNPIVDKEDFIFMVSGWKAPKDPFTVIEAFSQLRKVYPSLRLAIGGFGEQWSDMQHLSSTLQINQSIVWLGKLDSWQIANWQQRSRLFIHCSHYETFSVVVAEALCCGTPVVASAVGGINELLTASNGIKVEENSKQNWQNAIAKALQKNYDYQAIAKKASTRFSYEAVGSKYIEVIRKKAVYA